MTLAELIRELERLDVPGETEVRLTSRIHGGPVVDVRCHTFDGEPLTVEIS